MRFQVKMDSLLQPAIQPGASLDYALPEEEAAISILSDTRFVLSSSGKEQKAPLVLQDINGNYEKR